MSVEFPPSSFEVVSFMQTLDHLDSPGRMLDKVRKWLAPGGLLFLSALINIESPMSLLFGPDFRLLHPFHVAYFTPQGIRRILRAKGFRVARLEYPWFRTPFFSAGEVKSLLAKTGRRLFSGAAAEKSPPFIGNIMNAYAIREDRA